MLVNLISGDDIIHISNTSIFSMQLQSKPGLSNLKQDDINVDNTQGAAAGFFPDEIIL